jgi:hypothetical protein
VPYRCPCGAEYLVSIGDTNLRWLKRVEQAAEKLDASLVDNSRANFTCHQCGTVHVRGNVDA